MARGLQSAGWALAKGETFCPRCAAERELPVGAGASGELERGEATQAGLAACAGAPEPFLVGSAVREARGPRTRRLLRASLGVLKDDPQLLIFPAVSMTLSLLVGALAFAISLGANGTAHNVRGVLLLATLVSAYPINFVSLYCGVALATVLAGRLDGQPLSASDGWSAARQRLGIIAAWTLVTCTVGAALRLIEQYVPLGAKLVVAFVDLSWSLATMFALPVLAYEGFGPRETFRRSSQILRQRWGTQLGGMVGLGVGSALVYVPLVALVVIGVLSGASSGTLLAVLGGAGLFAAIAVQSALEQIFRVFVYRNAVGLGTSPSPFAQADLQAPFVARGRGAFKR